MNGRRMVRSVVMAMLIVALPAVLAAAEDLADKLRALEEARRAGILTEAEYARKKAELQPPAADAQKLKALEDARKAGVLSEAEYQKKRAELLGAAPVPAAAPATGKLYRHATGLTFRHPDNWTVAEQENLILLTPPNPAMADGGPAEAYAVVGESVAGENIASAADPAVGQYLDAQILGLNPAFQRVGQPADAPMLQGKGALYEWQAAGPAGQALRARAYAAIVKDMGVALVAIGLKDKLDARDAEVRKIFASFGAEAAVAGAAVGDADLMRHFAGTWKTFTKYSETTVVLYPDGRYAMRRESSSGGQFRDGGGNVTGAWGVASDNKGDGRWTIRGTREQGTITLAGNDGTVSAYPYKVHVKDGRVYANEYLFDGVLYGKQ